MDVVVIGGGAVGLCTAEALQRRGAEVTVIEAEAWGEGASAGNAGWVSPGLSNPVPAPGVMAQAIRWMPNPKSPLLIRVPKSFDFLSWSYAFWRATKEDRYSAGLAALVALCDRAVADFRALTARGIEFEWHDEKGILFVARTQKGLDAERAVLEDVEALGHEVRLKVFNEEEALEYEPNLRPGIAGAVLSPRECHVRPETLTRGLVDRLNGAGVDMQEGVRVSSLTRDGDGWLVRDNKGRSLRSKAVVVAAGVATRSLVEPLGVKLPLEGGKGYSLTFEEPAVELRGSLYLLEARLAVVPYNGALRFAGTMELGSRKRNISAARLKAVEQAAKSSVQDWSPHGRRQAWAGFRPMTPDGLPVLGPVPGHPGLSVATGHAMLGITLAPTSGELVAATALEGGTSLELAPFSIARFGNLASNSVAPATGASGA